MSERGRARGRGRSRPAVPSDDGSAPSGAAGVTTSSAEVEFLILNDLNFDRCLAVFSPVSFHQPYLLHHQLQQRAVLVRQLVKHHHLNGQQVKQHHLFNRVIFVVLVVVVQ